MIVADRINSIHNCLLLKASSYVKAFGIELGLPELGSKTNMDRKELVVLTGTSGLFIFVDNCISFRKPKG